MLAVSNVNDHGDCHKIYHDKVSDRAMNQQICHVSDYIWSEADVKQHVYSTEKLLR